MADSPFIPEWVGGANLKDRPPLEKRAGIFFPGWLNGKAAPEETETLIARKTGPATVETGEAAPFPDPATRVQLSTEPPPPILLRGGRCIIPSVGIVPFDVLMANGKIQQIGKSLSAEGCDLINAEDKYVIPGVIDPHTHVGLFDSFQSEVTTESRSALLNGVTTMGAYVGSQESYLNILDSAIQDIAQRSMVDIFFHLPIFTREQLEEIPLYYARYGIKSFKAYMCGIPGLIPSLDEGFLLDLMETVAKLGKDAILNIHAENYHIVEWATAKLQKEIPNNLPLNKWTDTHPGFAEAEAVQRAVLLAKQKGTQVYFVHISAKETLAMIKSLQAQGNKFFVETTSPYLTLTDETALGPLAKMVPPIRTEEDRLSLWEGLAADVIDTIGSDHTPLTISEKQPDMHLWETMPGYPAVGTHMTSVIDAACKSNFPLLKLVEKMTLAPAKIFGLYPRKGTLLPGSDADLVVLDIARTKRVSPDTAASRSDFALHQGDTMVGWPEIIFKSGRPVYVEDRKGRQEYSAGKYLRRDNS